MPATPTPTSRGKGVGLDYNWSILYNDPSSLSTSIVFAAKSPLPLLVETNAPSLVLFLLIRVKKGTLKAQTYGISVGGKGRKQTPWYMTIKKNK